MIVDYDDSTQQYEILLEEGMSDTNLTFKNLFFNINEVKQNLKWNPRRQQQIEILLKNGK